MTLIAEHIEGDTRDRSLSVGGATQNVIGMGRTGLLLGPHRRRQPDPDPEPLALRREAAPKVLLSMRRKEIFIGDRILFSSVA
ncbi:hypothetical protein IVB46_42080 [Bradyrhizobium sp. 61]|uniref:hypothetical protein n=1 Tax=unclassified Bradyrhizobium TaxID=2631580 RepID=UPI001FFA8EC1|nr:MULTISPECIES: hypothetical protein [unclassified Bradyrhizobium]MCK1281822.1 hypothetical protein [Bradyrhizobium sp. 61]MCK1459662.1 hypothetical protein [Bradyrhizobium sp. 2]